MLKNILNKDIKQIYTDVSSGIRLPKFITLPMLILAVTVVFVVLLFPYHETVQPFDLPKIGEAAKETIIAPFTFDIKRLPEELERRRQEAMDEVLLVMDYDVTVAREVVKSIEEAKGKVTSYIEESSTDSVKRDIKRELSKDISERAVSTLLKRPKLLDEAIQQASFMLEKGVASVLFVRSPEHLAELRAEYNTDFDQQIHYDKNFVSLLREDSELVVSVAEIPVKEIALEQVVSRLKRDLQMDDEALSTIYEVLFAYVRPNINVNRALTMQRRQEAAKEIRETSGKVIKDTEIVRKHQEVTPEVMQKIRSMHMAMDRTESTLEKKRIRTGNLGRLMLVLIPLFFMAFYLKNYEPELMKSPKRTFAFALILLLQLLIIRLGLAVLPKFFEGVTEFTLIPEYINPVFIGVILSAILFNLRLSMIMALFVSLYYSVVLGFNQFFFIYTFLGSLLLALFTYKIRYRWHFFRAIPPSFIICIINISMWHFIGYQFSLIALFQNYLLAFFGVTGSVFIAMAFTPFFERIFDITTDMTLVELSDMNHPILKRLSIEAAGTYNHSVLVGNLAESAALRIGANALLARVASYYHDIGKIEKSDYFVENCMHGDKNRHNKLTPSMSALVISSHVREGVDLAKKHKLPLIIQDIIRQHHGTSTVSFFYEKALEQDPHKQVQEKDFRYPGPPPQTREAAIIMLADSVEAASRSIASSSPKLLRELVKKIIRDKFLASQLDQCNLTQRDLYGIVEGFMPVLQGIFHTRIEYPAKKKGVLI
ncbi:HDIG domain-containing protein [Chitinispirillales bacterium ANBcel5]|uniref:HD family phosphohydrolase n=1 Tax=Cellulosispirillum alkaliphilum TaxID=3039283 RepID=UPI002A565013|nr:HDIG domain-containing protein [Chitinispirillales bacterium ANBcel5]